MRVPDRRLEPLDWQHADRLRGQHTQFQVGARLGDLQRAGSPRGCRARRGRTGEHVGAAEIGWPPACRRIGVIDCRGRQRARKRDQSRQQDDRNTRVLHDALLTRQRSGKDAPTRGGRATHGLP